MNVSMKAISSIVVLGVAVALSGCGRNDPVRSGSQSPASQPVAIAAPHAKATFSEVPVAPKPAVTPDLISRGKVLYAQNCLACHGEKGDGKGDAAAFLAPKPRDFVTANYRLRSTASGNLPTDVDLFRSISHGMAGTPMPPWKHMLSDDDRWALVEYLKSFSPRF